MPSAAYQVLREALLQQRRVSCVYEGRRRDLCPVVIGHTDAQEKVLAYQVGGDTRRGPLATPNWKCLFVAKVKDARLADGPWLEGESHVTTQTCVTEIDLDINIHVRKRRR